MHAEGYVALALCKPIILRNVDDDGDNDIDDDGVDDYNTIDH